MIKDTEECQTQIDPLEELLARAKEDIMSKKCLGETMSQRFRSWVMAEKWIRKAYKLEEFKKTL